MREIVKIEHLYKSYYDHVVLNDMNMTIYENDFVIINGVSGCGKSTLLNIIGLLDRKDKGNFELFGEKAPKPFSKQAEKLLRDKIGYLFQNFALVENETVQFNLEMIMDKKIKDKKERIKTALVQVNLAGYEEKKIYECSGGEQQRIAVARLLLKPCELILADEPTASYQLLTKISQKIYIFNFILAIYNFKMNVFNNTTPKRLLFLSIKRFIQF